MKSKFFLLSLVALALAFTACNKNQDEPLQSETDATISVAVKSADLRAYEDGAGDADMKVHKLAVMVYQGGAQVAYKEAADASTLEVKDIETTSGAKTLVVVANYANENLKGLSLDKVKALTHTLSADDQDPSMGTFMLTAEPVSVMLDKGKNYYGYADGDGNRISVDQPIELKHIHAGISLAGVTVEFAESYATLYGVKFDAGQLIALIAKAQSNVFGESLVNADANYFYGVKLFGTKANKYTPANYTEMAELKMDLTEVAPTMTGKGFYVLENNSTKHPTILCLKGELTQADGTALTDEQAAQAVEAGWIVSATDHSTYYPVLVNWTKEGYSYDTGYQAKNAIERNHKYEITLKVTGPGTNSPEDPTAEKANLDVKCKVLPWVIVKQNVVW
ncbi:fimbrial protein [uncultured Porphyromonas sp.]|uniref:fimbrial protein n=1 Tax=uncultured Porphyromonas sp. TaxID=159274 RepID=UPI00266B3F2C|nr:fimbrial protein [uncultured Porphyromonas sp.]